MPCVTCGRALEYLPDLREVGSLETVCNNEWMSPIPRVAGRLYRLCANYTTANVCNWAIPAQSRHTLCERAFSGDQGRLARASVSKGSLSTAGSVCWCL
ncbi:MAG: hypothetical protein EXS09_16915 [Gemmataceae bacterium]|nr:hypothetical protein [Gemmataceae bacterium]